MLGLAKLPDGAYSLPLETGFAWILVREAKITRAELWDADGALVLKWPVRKRQGGEAG
jgi:hypothetical protein